MPLTGALPLVKPEDPIGSAEERRRCLSEAFFASRGGGFTQRCEKFSPNDVGEDVSVGSTTKWLLIGLLEG